MLFAIQFCRWLLVLRVHVLSEKKTSSSNQDGVVLYCRKQNWKTNVIYFWTFSLQWKYGKMHLSVPVFCFKKIINSTLNCDIFCDPYCKEKCIYKFLMWLILCRIVLYISVSGQAVIPSPPAFPLKSLKYIQSVFHIWGVNGFLESFSADSKWQSLYNLDSIMGCTERA